MTDTPETIYLIPGEYDGEECLVWCDSPAPGEGMDPTEAMEYVRKDMHDVLVDDLLHHADRMLKAIQADDFALDPESQRAADKLLFDSTEDYLAFKEAAYDIGIIDRVLEAGDSQHSAS